jgi:anti-sigma factor ChrR (cupin superfamily)
MTCHTDAEELSLYRAGGLLSGPRIRALRVHLRSCPECARLDSELANLAGLLAGMPRPSMPQRFAMRIEQALAEQARPGSG